MIFSDLRFLLFFTLVFVLHWSFRTQRARKVLLLFASWFFYACWDWRFLSLILFSTLVDYLVARRIEAQDGPKKRKAWLSVSLLANLGLLFTFKYLGFFVESAARLINAVGFDAHQPTLEIILPVGISFYTFQTLSYTIDVYRGKLRGDVTSLSDFALFVGFFPQLVAGPIVRAVDFLPQLVTKQTLASVAFRANLGLFLVGFFKKACVSDNISGLVDRVFAAPEAFDTFGNWIGALFFSVQIYCDFSGYSDMAIACAGLLGYRLRENFDHPYLSTNLQDFWRRWHISLSFWLRDYVYIALGGNRSKPARVYVNLALTTLIAGLWHGAAWTFVLFGALHGVGLVICRAWKGFRGTAGQASGFLGALPTQLLVLEAFVIFRASDLDEAWQVIRGQLGLSTGTQSLGSGPLFVLFLLFALHVAASTRFFRGQLARLPDWAFAILLGLSVPCALALMNRAVQPFIYFQF